VEERGSRGKCPSNYELREALPLQLSYSYHGSYDVTNLISAIYYAFYNSFLPHGRLHEGFNGVDGPHIILIPGS